MTIRGVWIHLALAMLIILPSHAATANEAAVNEAVAAAETWLGLIDTGEFDKSWETAAALFKGAVPRDQWVQKISGGRGPFGQLISREVTSTKYATSLPGAPDGEYVVIEFRAAFENKAQAIETVTPMKDPDGAWRVGGYYIR